MKVHELIALLQQQAPEAAALMESQRNPTLCRVTGAGQELLRKCQRCGDTWYEP